MSEIDNWLFPTKSYEGFFIWVTASKSDEGVISVQFTTDDIPF